MQNSVGRESQRPVILRLCHGVMVNLLELYLKVYLSNPQPFWRVRALCTFCLFLCSQLIYIGNTVTIVGNNSKHHPVPSTNVCLIHALTLGRRAHITLLHMRKQRHKEFESLAQGHRAGKQERAGLPVQVV